MIYSSLIVLSFISSVYSACDNHCSGHGSCSLDDVCQCYDNWGVGMTRISGDCSDRTCPFDIAWVDNPDINGNFHKYLECSGKGICQRDTGECACFDGYYGATCQRFQCPNDCNGHGTCEYIKDLTFANSFNDYSAIGYFAESKTFSYYGWDSHKARACVCDPLYTDADCSKRICPHGTDILATRDNLEVLRDFHVQRIEFNIPSNERHNAYGKTFALSFKSKLNETYITIPIVMGNPDNFNHKEFAHQIREALLNLPNKIIDNLIVSSSTVILGTGSNNDPENISAFKMVVHITFTGDNVQGEQNLIVIHNYDCSDGCTPKITGVPLETRNDGLHIMPKTNLTEFADYNSYECGRRGKCDYTTGLCKCFSGYAGDSCGTLHALF